MAHVGRAERAMQSISYKYLYYFEQRDASFTALRNGLRTFVTPDNFTGKTCPTSRAAPGDASIPPIA